MFRIGIINKAHGTRGEVVVTTESDSEPPQNQIIYLKNRSGDFIPARVQELRTIDKSNKISFFVLFTGIADRSSAESLKGMELYVDQLPDSIIQPDETPDIFSCEGYQVQDSTGACIGWIDEVLDNPAHPIFSVSHPVEGYSFLIPVVSEYITDINHDTEMVTGKNLELLRDI
jgi:16S rRNA processing protein RimM